MIKKIFMAALIALGLGAAETTAQVPAQLSLSYGGYTQMDASDMHDGWHNVNNAWGALTAGVNFRVAPKLWVGPSYTFSSTSTKGNPGSKLAYHAIMLNARYDYWQRRAIRIYAHAGIGAEITHLMPKGDDSYNKSYCAFQLVPVGIEYGVSRSISVFGELGYGAQGLIQAGVHINL